MSDIHNILLFETWIFLCLVVVDLLKLLMNSVIICSRNDLIPFAVKIFSSVSYSHKVIFSPSVDNCVAGLSIKSYLEQLNDSIVQTEQ